MAKQQKFRFDVPKDLTPAERRRIGMDVITFIQEMAISEHKGFSQDTGRYRRFPYYTKSYAKKKGTSPSNVDLILTSEMFNSMEVLADRSGSITVGFPAGEINGKVEGNQIGSYGRDPNPKKARPFLGISRAELTKIIDKIRAES